MSENIDAMLGVETPKAPAAPAGSTANTSHPLYGIKGWLKLGVVVNLYLAPIVFVLSQVVTWISYGLMMDRYPGLVVVGLFNTLVGGYLVMRGMRIARGFRDYRPRTVQEAKTLLWLNVVYVLVSIPVVFLSGMNADQLIGGIAKAIILNAISFTVIYSYLNASRRVEANFPDWKDP